MPKLQVPLDTILSQVIESQPVTTISSTLAVESKSCKPNDVRFLSDDTVVCLNETITQAFYTREPICPCAEITTETRPTNRVGVT